MALLTVWIVTSLSLLVISRIGIFGIDIEDVGTALIFSVVLGLLNAVLRPILGFLSFPLLILSFGLFSVFINAAVFWLAANLVSGFELRRGCFSALIGPIALAVLNAVILSIVT
ncbi:MAG: phage holin family protein [Caldilineaceae bacterium SB0668_bin_21]|nr:phage holin family protein [Caldilineaceae bacterium SB0668_bin_21]MYC22711.1 phage holin family protein [Caldilineaceae bacterium SB0662_bin_25]